MTPELLEWAQLVFVMEKAHRTKLRRRFGAYLRHAHIICLDIPDDYAFMDPPLVALLETRAGPHLRSL